MPRLRAIGIPRGSNSVTGVSSRKHIRPCPLVGPMTARFVERHSVHRIARCSRRVPRNVWIVPENWDTGVCASILFGFWYNGATQVFRPGNAMLSWAYWRFVFFPPHLNCTVAVGFLQRGGVLKSWAAGRCIFISPRGCALRGEISALAELLSGPDTPPPRTTAAVGKEDCHKHRRGFEKACGHTRPRGCGNGCGNM